MLTDPAVTDVVVFTGGAGNTPNSGRMFITLKPLAERKMSADDVINRLRGKLAHLPGASLFLQAVQDLRIGGRSSNAQYQYTLQSTDLGDLNAFAPRLLGRFRELPMLRDVSSDQQTRGLEAGLAIDRDMASRLGILPQAIDDSLYDAFGQRPVSIIFGPLNQYRVVLEVAPRFQQDPDALRSVYVKSSTGAQVPLSAIAHFAPGSTPLSVNHQGQFPAVTLSFNLAPASRSGDAVTAIEAAGRDVKLPPSIRGSFQGTALAFQSSLASQPYLILAALIAVYIVLGVLYESFIHPITILSTLPSAGVGAILALMLFGIDLNVIAMIGIVLLIGIVKKNAIMMIDFALDAQRADGQSPAEAHLPGLDPALPADHDDHPGRAPGRPAAGARHGRGRGGAAAARRHHRGRPAHLPAPHALHDARRLSLPRAPQPVASPSAGGAGSRALPGGPCLRAGELARPWSSRLGSISGLVSGPRARAGGRRRRLLE